VLTITPRSPSALGALPAIAAAARSAGALLLDGRAAISSVGTQLALAA
jgi:hypothetical protein